MNIELKEVNKLPVRTWSWLKINNSSIKETIPDRKPYGKNPIVSGKSILEDILIKKEEDKVKEISSVNTGMGKEAVEFIRANQNSGISLRIPAGRKIKEPVCLEYILDEENPTVIDLNHIFAEEDSEVTVVLNYRSGDESPVFHGGLTYLHGGKNAVINLIQVQLLNADALHLTDLGAYGEENSRITITQGEFGGSLAVSGIGMELKEDKSEAEIQTILFGDKNRSIDLNYVVNHWGKQSHSEMHVSGAMLDESRKVFRGTLDFKKGAEGAIGHESENTLLFSPKIKNVSAPLILCQEESVEGKHAANSGKIDEDALFYMMSRGLDEVSAKKLIIEAMFQPVIDKIPMEDIQERMKAYMKERLYHVKSL